MLELEVKAEMSFEQHYIVKEHHLADFIGSGDISVLSTPSMIMMMESTSRIFIQQYLPENYISVGTHVNVSHKRASKKGDKIRVSVKVKEIEKKHLILNVTAFLNENKIGEGIHERHIVNKEKFLKKIF